MWNLQVNANKIKVMIVSERKERQNIEFYLNGQKLEIVDTFTYLGVGMIRTEVSVSAQTWFIRYLFVYLLLIFTVYK
jgi:hypothetical protein